MRDKFYEQHPPVFSAVDEVRNLRDGIKSKLVALGFSTQSISKMETALVIPSKPTRKGWIEYRLARALFFAARFARSVMENNWQAAACYSLWMGRDAQKALERETALMEMGWTKLSRRQNNDDAWREIRRVVEARIIERRGLGSAKELHTHLKVEVRFKWNLKKFSRQWSKDKMVVFKVEQRKKFTS